MHASPSARFLGLPAGMTAAQVHAAPAWRGRSVSTRSAAPHGVEGKSAGTMDAAERVATVLPGSGSALPGSVSRCMEVRRPSRLVAVDASARSVSAWLEPNAAMSSGIWVATLSVRASAVGEAPVRPIVPGGSAGMMVAEGSAAHVPRDRFVSRVALVASPTATVENAVTMAAVGSAAPRPTGTQESAKLERSVLGGSAWQNVKINAWAFSAGNSVKQLAAGRVASARPRRSALMENAIQNTQG